MIGRAPSNAPAANTPHFWSNCPAVSEPKSRSRETTFEQDLHPRRDLESIRALIRELSEQVARSKKSYTGEALRKVLGAGRAA